MSEMKYTVLRASDWLNQDRSNDSMRGRIVILKHLSTSGRYELSTHEQWEDSVKKNWEKPKEPNFCYGHYGFQGVLEADLSDEILHDFYTRATKLFNHYLKQKK